MKMLEASSRPTVKAMRDIGPERIRVCRGPAGRCGGSGRARGGLPVTRLEPDPYTQRPRWGRTGMKLRSERTRMICLRGLVAATGAAIGLLAASAQALPPVLDRVPADALVVITTPSLDRLEKSSAALT